MTNRSYLPFLSARTYKDRKMAKWMGFFLSDHQTALLQSHFSLELGNAMSQEERLIWLSRLYAQQCKATFYIQEYFKSGSTIRQLQGYIQNISLEEVIIKIVPSDSDLNITKDINLTSTYVTVSLDQIMRITTEEMNTDEN